MTKEYKLTDGKLRVTETKEVTIRKEYELDEIESKKTEADKLLSEFNKLK